MSSDWISVYDDAIPAEFCDECISLFNNPDSTKGEHVEWWRRCKEFTTIDHTPLWEKLKSHIKQNYDRYRNEHQSGVLNSANTLESPNLFRYDVNVDNPNIFNWHADSWNFPTATRQVSVIIYLNDVMEGGETSFKDRKVAPKKGRVLMFPSFFNYIHRGEAPISNSKYIIVAWIHFDGQGHAYRVHQF
jgi:prolyl 4-hydroxylase